VDTVEIGSEKVRVTAKRRGGEVRIFFILLLNKPRSGTCTSYKLKGTFSGDFVCPLKDFCIVLMLKGTVSRDFRPLVFSSKWWVP
jgi:hypothetical protein